MPSISDSRRAARIRAVQEHFRIENTHDLDAVMDTFGDQASSLANNVLHEGWDAVRAFYGEFFRGFPDLREALVNAKRVRPDVIRRMCAGNLSAHIVYTWAKFAHS